MLDRFVRSRRFGVLGVSSAGALVIIVTACSSTTSTTPATDAGTTTQAATCASPGTPTAGAADTHCNGQDTQSVSAASCHVTDAGDTGDDDGGDAGMDMGDDCDYGTTMFGTSGSDDDCKYDVSWTSTSLCEGTAGVTFTVTVKTKDGQPVTGIPDGVLAETYIPTDPSADCDDKTSHPSPTANPILAETKAGSGIYSGNVAFDKAGQWTIRFHIHEECADVLDDSPHGHAAFRLTIP